MKHRKPKRRFHRKSLGRPTAGTIVRIAQIALLAIGGWALSGYSSGSITEEQAARAALALGMVVLVAAPGHRGVPLLGAVAIWLTSCEFLAASRTGEFALWHWAVALATLALVMILTRLPEFRAGARANPWRRLGPDIRACQATLAKGTLEGRGRWLAAPSSVIR